MSRREVVVITGASAGLGRATVREFAKHGASIGLIARGTDGLQEARREVEAAGGRALVLALDVANAADVEAAAERVESTLGPIDIMGEQCNGVGIFTHQGNDRRGVQARDGGHLPGLCLWLAGSAEADAAA